MPVSESDLIVTFVEKLRDALKKKDLDLAEAQKAASDKTKLTEESSFTGELMGSKPVSTRLVSSSKFWHALSLVRVHYKEAREDKLVSLKVANTRKHDFRSFMETFIAAATRIADGEYKSIAICASSLPAKEHHRH